MSRVLLRYVALVCCVLGLAVSLPAQQAQTTTAPVVDVNAKYVNGMSPGYWVTPGVGLRVHVSPGSVFCNGVMNTYPGGVLTVGAGGVNYLYLNTSSGCAPAVKPAPFTAGDVPIATVNANATSVTGVVDGRTIFQWIAPASGGTSFATGGDVSGSSGALTVQGIQGRPVLSTAPATGQALIWNGSAYVPQTPASGGTSFATGGDVSGSSGALTVQGIQGHPVSAAAPTAGQNLVWNGSAYVPQTPASGGVSFAVPPVLGNSAPNGVYASYLDMETTNPTQFGGIGVTDHYHYTNFNTYARGTYNSPGPLQYGEIDAGLFSGPGVNVASPEGFTYNTGWSTTIAHTLSRIFMRRGIKSYFDGSQGIDFYSVGDGLFMYPYIYYDGGVLAAEDEAIKMYGGTMSQNPIYKGTGAVLTQTATTTPTLSGSGSPAYSRTNTMVLGDSFNGGGSNHATDGAMLLNGSTGVLHCSLAGSMPTPFNGSATINVVAVTGCSLPVVTAWGTVSAEVGEYPNGSATRYNANIPLSQSFSVTLGSGSGSFATPAGTDSVSDHICYWGPDTIENARVTAVSGTTITANLRSYNPAGGYVFQGPACAPYRAVVFDVDTNFDGTGDMTVYWSPGGIDSTHLLISTRLGPNVTGWTPRTGETPERTDTVDAKAAFLSSGVSLFPTTEITASLAQNLFDLDHIQIEDNAFPVSGSDTMMIPHPAAVTTCMLCLGNVTRQFGVGSFATRGIEINMSGPSASGAFKPMNIKNNAPCSYYIPCGGSLFPPTYAYAATGYFGSGLYMDSSPMPNGGSPGAAVWVDGTSTANFDLFNLPVNGARGAQEIHYNATTGDVQMLQGGYAATPSSHGWFHFHDFFNSTDEWGGLSMIAHNVFALGSAPGVSDGELAVGTVYTSTNIVAGVYQGQATAPSGSCTTVGWVFSQDGHATFCNGAVWVTKI